MIYDISRPMTQTMAVYKNKEEKKFKRRIDASFPNDTYCESSAIQWNLHTGTHVDAPSHMIDGGENIDKMPLENYIGLSFVADMTHIDDVIEAEDIQHLPIQKGMRVLFRTKNSLTQDFDPNFIYLGLSAAKLLVEKQVSLVGIDAMSLERGLADHPAHIELLSNHIAILEDIRLEYVKQGRYILMALPISMHETEAAPVRAVLVDENYDFLK